jgi:pyruvate dehydrogenase E1 component alpha subunit
VCEDNGLAVHSDRAARQSYRLSEHAAAYGIPGRRLVEGWDMLAIRDATVDAARQVRERGPYVLEIATSRYKEHVGVGEDFQYGYRTSDNVDAWKRRDPLLADTELAARLLPEVEREIDAAVAFAEASPAPGRADLLTDVI